MKLNHRMKIFISLSTFVFLLSVLPLNNLKAAGSSGKNGDIVWYITYDTMIQQHISGDWTLTCKENVCTAEGERFYSTLLFDDNDIYSDENKLVVQWIKDFPLNWLELKAKHCDYSLEDDVYLRTVTNIEISENVESVCSNALRNLKNLKKIFIYSKNINLADSGVGYFDENTKSDDLTIFGYKNSTAEIYANEKGFNFISLDGKETPITETEKNVSGQLKEVTWKLNNDILFMQHTNGEWKITYQYGVFNAEGEKIYSLSNENDDSNDDEKWLTYENAVMLRWINVHPVYKINLNIKRCDLSFDNSITGNATEIEIGENVEYIGSNSFIELSKLKSVYVYSREIDLSDSGMGYFNEDIKSDILTIHGYKNSTAETYANENGFTFIPLDEPVTEVTTSATEEVITESTTTQTVTTDSVTQQSQSTVITDAASAKVNSTPKTGEKNIYGIIALGISAAVLSVVSSKKKRNRDN